MRNHCAQAPALVRPATLLPLMVAIYFASHLLAVANASNAPSYPAPLPTPLRTAVSPAPFLGPELNTIWSSSSVADEIMPEASAFSLFSQLLENYFANPCTDPDADANGAWKAMHPPSKRVPTTFTDIQQQQAEQMLGWLRSPPWPASSNAGQALADTWASAEVPQNGWAAFAPQAARLDALADKTALQHYLCDGVTQGRGGVVGIHPVLGQHLLVAGAKVLPPSGDDLFALDDDHPDVKAHLARVATLLQSTGLPHAQCAGAAAACYTLEKSLAQVHIGLDKVTLAQAQQQAPAFPWPALWQALGLDAHAQTYADLPAFQQLGTLLQTHTLHDWKHFLRYQEAVHAQPFITPPGKELARLQQLDEPNLAGPLLAAVYTQCADQQRIETARAMLADLIGVFKADVGRSALGPSDQAIVCATLDALQLHLGDDGGSYRWAGTSPTATYLANIQALGRSQAQQNLHALRTASTGPLSVQKGAHHLYAAADCVQDRITVTQALLDGLMDTFGSTPEGRWATLGAVLGHEIKHCLRHRRQFGGLSNNAEQVFDQHAEAVRQRVMDIQVEGVYLDAARVGEEVDCDLSGLSTARRAGMAEAQAAGRSFDDVVFFRTAAQVHAAHPTARQQTALLGSDHPPASVRAGLVRQVEGFEAAHGCPQDARAPFNQVI